MSDDVPKVIQPLQLGTIYPTKTAFDDSVNQYKKSTGIDVKTVRSGYITAKDVELGFDKKLELKEILLICDTAETTPLNWDNRKKKKTVSKTERKKPGKDKNIDKSEICQMVISAGIVKKPSVGLKVNFLEAKHTCKKQKSNSEKNHLSKRKRHGASKQEDDTGSSSESADERPLEMDQNADNLSKRKRHGASKQEDDTNNAKVERATQLKVAFADFSKEMLKCDNFVFQRKMTAFEEFVRIQIKGNEIDNAKVEPEKNPLADIKIVSTTSKGRPPGKTTTVIGLPVKEKSKKGSEELKSKKELQPQKERQDEKQKIKKTEQKVTERKKLEDYIENSSEEDSDEEQQEVDEEKKSVRKGFKELDEEDKKKLILLWLLPHLNSNLKSVIKLDDIESMKAVQESIFDEAVDVELLKPMCENDEVATKLVAEFKEKKDAFMKDDCNYSCGKCKGEIDEEQDSSVCCDACLLWFHAKCVGFDVSRNDPDASWFCETDCIAL